MGALHQTHAAEQLRRQVFAEETHCWLCGRWVDQSLPARTPQSRTVDHIIPVSAGGAPYDRGNARLAHWSCNSRRGARVREPEVVGASRRW